MMEAVATSTAAMAMAATVTSRQKKTTVSAGP